MDTFALTDPSNPFNVAGISDEDRALLRLPSVASQVRRRRVENPRLLSELADPPVAPKAQQTSDDAARGVVVDGESPVGRCRLKKPADRTRATLGLKQSVVPVNADPVLAREVPVSQLAEAGSVRLSSEAGVPRSAGLIHLAGVFPAPLSIPSVSLRSVGGVVVVSPSPFVSIASACGTYGSLRARRFRALAVVQARRVFGVAVAIPPGVVLPTPPFRLCRIRTRRHSAVPHDPNGRRA